MKKFYQNKKVIVTGHTGFKGSWLCAWLYLLGAKVYGIALDPPTKPSHFELLDLKNKINSKILDIRNKQKIKDTISSINPDIIFHLAAQPIVSESFEDPVKTFDTNFMGSINVMESLRENKHDCILVMITSDKCYENKEWIWGYRENDEMGGSDPYSASKGATELAISSYYRSFFADNDKMLIASARAGNVIGGGDWAKNRIIPDLIKCWSEEKLLKIRSPNSTRPWQHVLEPVSGYLNLAWTLYEDQSLNGQSFNFGPDNNDEYTVEELVKKMSLQWKNAKWKKNEDFNSNLKEASLLKLNCDKSLNLLNWKQALNFDETASFTINWYKIYYQGNKNIFDISTRQIEDYMSIANKRNIKWAI